MKHKVKPMPNFEKDAYEADISIMMNFIKKSQRFEFVMVPNGHNPNDIMGFSNATHKLLICGDGDKNYDNRQMGYDFYVRLPFRFFLGTTDSFCSLTLYPGDIQPDQFSFHNFLAENFTEVKRKIVREAKSIIASYMYGGSNDRN